jgi:hypothetical protein
VTIVPDPSPLEYGCHVRDVFRLYHYRRGLIIETFGRYFIHDPVHHLYDVTGVRYRALPAPDAYHDGMTAWP